MTGDRPRASRLDGLRAQTPAMLDHLAALVRIETPSEDLAACEAGAAAVSELAATVIQDAGEWLETQGRPHLRWRWPAADGRPGVGSPTSRGLIEDAARRARAALIMEPSAGGALKTERKGVGIYGLEVRGRAAHAGLEPENGANALIELCHLLLAAGAMGRPGSGTSVTPTVAAAGTARNVLPALARADLDVRACLPDEADRVDRELRALKTTIPGTTLTITGGLNRPPMPRSSSATLYTVAASLAADLGLGPLQGVSVGGGSDGNFTAAAGCPTLDGLGAVGAGAHAEGEHITIGAMPERAALLAGLLDHVRIQSGLCAC